MEKFEPLAIYVPRCMEIGSHAPREKYPAQYVWNSKGEVLKHRRLRGYPPAGIALMVSCNCTRQIPFKNHTPAPLKSVRFYAILQVSISDKKPITSIKAEWQPWEVPTCRKRVLTSASWWREN